MFSWYESKVSKVGKKVTMHAAIINVRIVTILLLKYLLFLQNNFLKEYNENRNDVYILIIIYNNC